MTSHGNLFLRIYRRWQTRRAGVGLREPNDQILSDIGINRGMIDYYIRHGRDPR